MLSAESAKALAEPFKMSELEWRPSPGGGDKKRIALIYVTNRAIMDRLDLVVGASGWKNEFIQWRAHGTLCGLSIRVMGSDAYNAEWVTKWDGADETDIEATKGGISDSMKRAAVQWGIGRYLYRMPEIWGPGSPGSTGKGWYFERDWEPKIPAEFLPPNGQVVRPLPKPPGHELPAQPDALEKALATRKPGELMVPEKALPPWIDDKIGMGQRSFHDHAVKEMTWRWMLEGNIDGGRHKYLKEIVERCKADEKAKKPMSDGLRVFWDRAAALLKLIDTGAPF